MTAWSSNLATNRLLVKLGGSESRGAQVAQRTLERLGAASSTFTSGYRAGTAVPSTSNPDAPQPPPLTSSRVTTAHDLARILYLLHSAALGKSAALRKSKLSPHEARVGLAMLLSSESTGDNEGLFRPALGPSFPLAQKHGWLTSARHSAAILYRNTGPKIAVLLTYKTGLTRREAAALGRRVIALVSP